MLEARRRPTDASCRWKQPVHRLPPERDGPGRIAGAHRMPKPSATESEKAGQRHASAGAWGPDLKRFDDDISAVCLVLNLDTADGRWCASIGAGSVARHPVQRTADRSRADRPALDRGHHAAQPCACRSSSAPSRTCAPAATGRRCWATCCNASWSWKAQEPHQPASRSLTAHLTRSRHANAHQPSSSHRQLSAPARAAVGSRAPVARKRRAQVAGAAHYRRPLR